MEENKPSDIRVIRIDGAIMSTIEVFSKMGYEVKVTWDQENSEYVVEFTT